MGPPGPGAGAAIRLGERAQKHDGERDTGGEDHIPEDQSSRGHTPAALPGPAGLPAGDMAADDRGDRERAQYQGHDSAYHRRNGQRVGLLSPALGDVISGSQLSSGIHRWPSPSTVAMKPSGSTRLRMSEVTFRLTNMVLSVRPV